MIYILVGHWAVGAPVGLYLCEAQGLGITGVWIGLGAGTLVATSLTLARLFVRRPRSRGPDRRRQRRLRSTRNRPPQSAIFDIYESTRNRTG